MPDQSDVLAFIEAQPGIQEWPALRDLVNRAMHTPRPDWELPIWACQAIGGDVSHVQAAVAALGCMQISIILIDDMLDNDPRGEYRRRGHAQTANMAVALQAAAFGILADCGIESARLVTAQRAMRQLALLTACGQELDTMDLPMTEASYWRIVRAKSTPFYATGLLLGAILGGADEQTQSCIYDIGCSLGTIVQIQDDLADAFVSPANPDWSAGRHNLAILYASLADYPAKERFLTLGQDVSQLDRLAEAQQILVTSGALSYCIYQLLKHYREVSESIAAFAFAEREPLQRMFDRRLTPVTNLLHQFDIAIPKELAHLRP